MPIQPKKPGVRFYFFPGGERDTPVSPCPYALLGAVVEADPKLAKRHGRDSVVLLRRVDGGERAPLRDALDLSPPPALEP